MYLIPKKEARTPRGARAPNQLLIQSVFYSRSLSSSNSPSTGCNRKNTSPSLLSFSSSKFTDHFWRSDFPEITSTGESRNGRARILSDRARLNFKLILSLLRQISYSIVEDGSVTGIRLEACGISAGVHTVVNFLPISAGPRMNRPRRPLPLQTSRSGSPLLQMNE